MSEDEEKGWRDISSAPKDGAEFLVWFPMQKEIGYGYHLEAGYGYPATFRFFWFDVEESADPNVPEDQPTLWQPLPAPPLDTEKTG